MHLVLILQLYFSGGNVSTVQQQYQQYEIYTNTTD